jgi:hypothetical protein
MVALKLSNKWFSLARVTTSTQCFIQYSIVIRRLTTFVVDFNIIIISILYNRPKNMFSPFYVLYFISIYQNLYTCIIWPCIIVKNDFEIDVFFPPPGQNKKIGSVRQLALFCTSFKLFVLASNCSRSILMVFVSIISILLHHILCQVAAIAGSCWRRAMRTQ